MEQTIPLINSYLGLSEEQLLKMEAQYCSWGDTVHYAEKLNIFRNAEGSFLYDGKKTAYLDLNMWHSVCNFGYKNKRSFKLSTIIDSNGVSISVTVDKASIFDVNYGSVNLHDTFVDIKCQNDSNKRYFLADSAYDSKNFKDEIKLLNIKPLIACNKRNIKNKELLKAKKFTTYEKKIYRKRIKIENSYSWLFKSKRVKSFNEKTLVSYMAFIFMAFIIILSKRQDNENK